MKPFIKGLKQGMSLFGHTIATLVNTILLTLVYLLGVGITSVIAKIFRKKFLKRKPEEVNSYWENLNLKTQNKENYYRQF